MLSEYLLYPEVDEEFLSYQVGSSITKNSDQTEDLDRYKVAFIGMADEEGEFQSANSIRTAFYSLSSSTFIDENVIDLGNIRKGATSKDSDAALYFVAEYCILHGVIPLVLSPNEDLAEEVFAALHLKQDPIEVSYIGSRIPLLADQLLDRLISNQKTALLSLNCIAFQGHLAPPNAIETLINLSFGQLRLGAVSQNQEEGELLLRNSGLTILHLDSIKLADAPASKESQPVGLTAEQFCQLSYYAGVSDNLFAALFAGCELHTDTNSHTAKIAALGLWYLIDGISNRKEDHPLKHHEFLKYKCAVGGKQPEIVFYKSKRTNRWWMDIDVEDLRNNFVPCTYSDYLKAVDGEIPNRYLNALQKLV
jgi:formiminoglutamase